MVSRNTTLVPSLGLRIGPACEAGLSARMRRERVSPQLRKKRRTKKTGELPRPALDLQLTGDHLCGQTVRCRSANQAD